MPRHAVYLQLLYRGWHVHVGKLYDKEVDFVAVKDGRTVYVQVTDEMFSDTTRQRELRSLQSIRDSYEKVIVVRQGRYEPNVDGIRILPAKDFFLGSLL
jgi:predicted AAA+ superfamily ATPase